ncbi:SPOR domain-containing protein [uncultured Algimonas sp.]|uniref:SPOR domain-containing protein n=1 Tax=uncultured Algimonas sp. TaxID=1547920 RepID=UPI002634CA54|nr:SPOR domain-containing protein [uncultured Algimonas sp.]
MSSDGPEFNPAMVADEPIAPFDVTRTSERAGLLKLVIGFGLLAAVAFIILKIYQPGVRDRGDPPLITADNTPFKVVPEDPGGEQTPDQDKEVFDVMSGADPSTDVVTLPPPETPVDRPVIADPDPVPDEPPAAEPDPVVTVEPQPREPAVLPAPPPAAGGSDWVVQVASLRSQAEAEATFARIRATHGAILSSYGSDIVRVDLGDKGIYYRARVDGFSDKSQAAATCERLDAAGQSCFVARR